MLYTVNKDTSTHKRVNAREREKLQLYLLYSLLPKCLERERVLYKAFRAGTMRGDQTQVQANIEERAKDSKIS